MIPLLFLGSMGTKGALMLRFTAAELLMHYWNSKDLPEVYIFDRRIHHGEIGALPSLASLIFGKVPISATALGILAGLGTGLVKDDLADIKSGLDSRKSTL